MSLRVSATAPAFILAGILAFGPGCSQTKGRTLEVGHHRVRLVLPSGWEHLDHGRSQVFRKEEAQISIEDLGPGSRRGMVREIEAARSIWLEGRRADAFARVYDLRGPSFNFTTSHATAEFWKPWWAMQAMFGGPDSAAIGAAFDSLVAGTEGLAPDSPDAMARYAVETALDPRRYEIARQTKRTEHGQDWIEVEAWDRLTHNDRHRVAVHDNDGYLLALRVDRGTVGQTAGVFEEMLRSIEVLPGKSP